MPQNCSYPADNNY
ncbi:unnamed protein product, partial [Allacma fusca]